MKKSFYTQLVISSALTLFVSAATAQHSWGSYHWARTANPFTLQVIDSMTTDWDTELDTALAEWSQSGVLDLLKTSADDSKGVRKRCQMVSGQMRVCNGAYGFNGWLGMATIGIDSNGHIVQGTAKMNDSYASYWDIYGEKNHVVCQEIGHVLGLGHTSEDGSSQQTCMDYSSDPNSQWPNQHDFDTLFEIYNHVDTYNSYDDNIVFSDPGGGGCNSPPGKGCNKNVAKGPPMGVRVFGNQFHEIWVAPRRGGGLWIHHVRLAP